MFVDKIHETSFRAKFSNNVTMSFAFVDIVALNDIWMINKF